MEEKPSDGKNQVAECEAVRAMRCWLKEYERRGHPVDWQQSNQALRDLNNYATANVSSHLNDPQVVTAIYLASLEKWQCIESAPKHATPIFGFSRQWEKPVVVSWTEVWGQLPNNASVWCWWDGENAVEPEYWMPIPPLPWTEEDWAEIGKGDEFG